MSNFLAWIKARWSEPSTHAAIAAALPVVRQFVPPQYQFIVDLAITVFAGNGVLRSEANKTNNPNQIPGA